jgi:hypothetical protein
VTFTVALSAVFLAGAAPPSSCNPPGNGNDAGADADAGSGSMPDTGTDTGSVADTSTDDSAPEASNGPIKTVFLILMENHNWTDIKGSTSAPYINGTLLPMASHCENYFDNPKAVHPSEPNYIWLESGDNLGITDDSDPSVNHQSTTQHLVTLLSSAGVSWKSYQEDIAAGTCPITSVNKYAPKHDPMVFFDDIVGNPPSSTSATCIAHVRPYGELAGDLTSGTVAQYNFITPNLCDDMHDSFGCATTDAVSNGDTWLSTEVPKILASSAYKDNGALFITWDESEGGELPIGMIVLSPKAKGGGFASNTKFFHSSMLRTVEEVFGVTPLLRDAANQPDLGELFTSFP